MLAWSCATSAWVRQEWPCKASPAKPRESWRDRNRNRLGQSGMTDNGTSQGVKGRRERSFINKRRTSSARQHKGATFCLSVRCLCWKERKFLSLHKVPPANAGRGEATLMLMQALWCRYRLMQPLSPVLPAHLLRAKRHFLSLSKENFFRRDEAIMRRTSSRQMEESKSDTDFTWLQHLEDFSPLFPIIIKSRSRAYINWHEGHLPSSKWSFLK